MDTHTTNLTYFEHLLLNRLSKGEVKGKIQEIAHPYRELMAYYRSAMMSMETKFQVLNEELSLQYDRNPIESIKTRLKSPESLLNKMIEKQLPLCQKKRLYCKSKGKRLSQSAPDCSNSDLSS